MSRWYSAVVGTICAVAIPTSLDAQCADGTPPPCEVRTAQVVQRRVQPPPTAERGRRFLVLPFRNVTRSPDHEWLVEGASALIGDALAQWEEISVVPAERLYPALRRSGLEPGQVMDEDRVRAVAEETGGWTAVTGEVLVTGGRIRLSARAYDVVTDEVVVRATENADGEGEILPAFERLAGQLLAAAGLDVTRLEAGTEATQSLEAYKAYLRGLAHYHRTEVEQAREAFQEAVRLDSTFAQAHLRLAETLMTTVDAIVDPQSPAYRHAERAAALSQRLPPRDREFVLAIAALFRARLAEARAGLGRILAADSNDLEALENLADIERMDPVLVATPAGEFPRGSLNESARLAKRALALDPGRHQNYQYLVGAYAAAAGANYGRIVGIRGEPTSILGISQAIVANPGRLFVAVLRDTIELVPVDSLDAVNPDTLEAARRRAQQVAVAWAEQWVAATPDAAAAQLVAAGAHMLAGSYDTALEHLDRADSLGVEIELLQNLAGDRIEILMRAGRYAEATAVADAMLQGGFLESPDVVMNVPKQQSLAWTYTLYVLVGRLHAADSLVARFRDRVLQAMPSLQPGQAAQQVLGFFGLRTDETTPVLLPDIPEAIRLAAADSLAAHLDALPEGGVLEQGMLNVFALATRGASGETAERVVGQWRATALRWLEDGRADLATSLALPAVNVDTSTAGQEETLALLRAIVRAAPDQWEAVYQIGRLGALTGRNLDEAEAALRRYLEQEPPEGAPPLYAAHWRLGMVLEQKGDLDGARAAYEEGARLNPQDADLRAALQRLGGGPPR